MTDSLNCIKPSRSPQIWPSTCSDRNTNATSLCFNKVATIWRKRCAKINKETCSSVDSHWALWHSTCLTGWPPRHWKTTSDIATPQNSNSFRQARVLLGQSDHKKPWNCSALHATSIATACRSACSRGKFSPIWMHTQLFASCRKSTTEIAFPPANESLVIEWRPSCKTIACFTSLKIYLSFYDAKSKNCSVYHNRSSMSWLRRAYFTSWMPEQISKFCWSLLRVYSLKKTSSNCSISCKKE